MAEVGSNGTITIAAGGSLAIAAQTICDIAAGQLTVTRVFGDLPEECTINVAVYTGSLTFQGGTSLAYFANKTLDATLPENHPKKELANKKTKFECKILNVKKPKASKIDDAFA